MAIYTTFFMSNPTLLLDGFPGWRLPLKEPVKREFTHPFTKQKRIIETREPEWGDEQTSEPSVPQYKVVSIKGNYQDYLEGRLPPFVRDNPHSSAKGLTNVELEPLGESLGIVSILEVALYNHPRSGAVLQQFHPDLVSKLRLLNGVGMDAVGQKWASIMSSPRYTHSVSGNKLSNGWSLNDAMTILQPIVELTKQGDNEMGMYLLIEA